MATTIFPSYSTCWTKSLSCQCCRMEVMRPRWRPLNRKYTVNKLACIVEISIATNRFPRSLNSLDISSMLSVLLEVTGSDQSNMAATNRKYINYYVYLTYISACIHDSNKTATTTPTFSRSSNTVSSLLMLLTPVTRCRTLDNRHFPVVTTRA